MRVGNVVYGWARNRIIDLVSRHKLREKETFASVRILVGSDLLVTIISRPFGNVWLASQGSAFTLNKAQLAGDGRDRAVQKVGDALTQAVTGVRVRVWLVYRSRSCWWWWRNENSGVGDTVVEGTSDQSGYDQHCLGRTTINAARGNLYHSYYPRLPVNG